MEPFKALTFLAATAIVSLVGAGAGGFYAGYMAGRGGLAHSADAPVVVATGPGGATVSLQPVLDDIRALSKQVDALAAAKAEPAVDNKPVLDEIKALALAVEGLKAIPVSRPSGNESASSGPDYSAALQDIRAQILAVHAKIERQEGKAPRALVDEIRSLSASVQSMEPATRRAVADEIRNALAALQNAEPKAPRAVMDELRTIAASVKPASSPQASVSDQIKVLTASIESLKAQLEDGSAQKGGGGNTAAELAQLRQLVAAASEQFGKCHAQLASLSGGAGAQSAPAANPAAASQGGPATVVFYDNVMLKKDQEKQYDEIGVRLALQSVGAKQIRVAVNRQGFGLSFGERKVFRSQDVECELNLMETNLNDSQARVSISCKR